MTMLNGRLLVSSARALDIEGLLGLLTLTVFSIWGVWELFRGGAHRFHLLGVFVALFLSGLTILIVHFFTSHAALSEAQLARERLRVSMAVGHSAIWDLDVKTGQERWFGDLTILFGVASDSLSAPGRDFYSYLHPADRQHVSQAVTEAREKLSPYRVEFRSVHPDGTVRWISGAGEFQYTKRGDPVRMLGIAVDITDRKLAERALLSSEEKFSRAFRESPVALTLTSTRDHRYLDVNQTFEEATGWRRDEVIARTPFDINIWADPAEREELAKVVLEKKTLRDFEVHYRRKNGSMGVGLASADLIEINGEPCILSAVVDITARKRAEEALRRKEHDLVEAQRLAHLGSWEWEIKTGLIHWSEELYRIYGLDPAKPVPTFEELPKLYTAESWNQIRKAMATRLFPDMELELIRPDGSTRWLHTRFEVTRDRQGTVTILRGVSRDITEEKQTADQLRESKSKLAVVVDSAMDAIITVDNQQRIVLFNPAAEKMFQCPASEAVGTHLNRFIPPPFRSVHNRHIEQFAKTGITNRTMGMMGALSAVRSNGEAFPMEASISRAETDGKKLLTVIIRDVTEQVRAEQALLESEQKFRRLIEHIGDALAVDDVQGRVVFANDQFLSLFGLRPEEIGRISLEDYVAPEHRAAVRDRHNRLMRGEEELDQHEYEGVRSDGTRVWVDANIVVIRDAEGKVVGSQKILRDVTERKRSEQAMASIGRRLIEAHEEERTRIGRELHDDINQRLALLAVELDRWSETLPSNPQLENYVRNAQQHIHEIAKDVQTLSHRLHSSKLDYLGLPTAANSFCRELSEKSDVAVKFSQAGVPRSIPKEVSLCLFRVLQEALQNAVKHSGVKNFTVDLRGTSEAVELTVIDTGSGFDEQEAFTRQGLGLISMRERLQLVNGELSVESHRGVGTTIRARVPLYRDGLQRMAS